MTTGTILEVRHYHYSRTHRRFYGEGTTQYTADGGRFETLRRGFVCAGCGDWLNDGERVYEVGRGYEHELCHS